MHLPSLFVALVYISGYLTLLFFAVCLACGIYYLVEMAEEYATLTKRLIRHTIHLHIILHPLLLFYERFPALPCVTGLIAHLTYYNLLSTFPYITPVAPAFMLSCFTFIISNVVWYTFFTSDHELFYRYRVAPLPATASFFFLMVWLVPIAFFCSLTVSDSALPNLSPSPQGSLSDSDKKRRRNMVTSTLAALSDFIKRTLAPRRTDDFLNFR